MRRELLRLAGFVVVGICMAGTALAQQVTQSESEGWLDSVGFATGFSRANLRNQGEYELTPMILRFGFDLDPTLDRWGLDLPGSLAFNLEPYYSYAYGPDRDEYEAGCGLFLRWSHCLIGPDLRFYLEIGAAPMYLSTNTAEQGSAGFNFLDQAGVGLTYAINDEWSVDVGGRGWHISNASIDEDNAGIEGWTALVGVTRRF